MTKYVYDFAEGSKDMKDLLGGKGANLCEMTDLGLPVPPGFVITTEACTAYLRDRRARPRGSTAEVDEHLAALEAAMGKRLGDADDPLLVSVRSGGEVLDAGDDGHRPQHRAQRRERAGPGQAVGQRPLRLGLLPAARADVRQDRPRRRRRGVRPRLRRGQEGEGHEGRPRARRGRPASSRASASRRSSQEQHRRAVPAGPARRRWAWRSRRSSSPGTPTARRLYRRQERIPSDLGTAVSVCSMVFGNLGMDSGTGVAFTRDPGSGAQRRLRRLPAERAGRGRRRRHPQHPAARPSSRSSTRRRTTSCMATMATLERHYRDLCDIEFTIERGKLWMLQTRVGKRTAGAAFRIATQLVDEGLITEDEALLRVTGAQLAQLMFPRFGSIERRDQRLTTGMSASPGAAVGKAVFDSATAVAAAAAARTSSWSAARPPPTTCPG